MKPRFSLLSIFAALIFSASALSAQELGPGFHKIKDGIYTFAPDQATTTCSFVVTEVGVLMIDSCNSPLDSRRMAAAIKKVTDKPIMFLIDTETHADHTGNHFIFSPPATVINAEGAAAGMRKEYNPKRAETFPRDACGPGGLQNDHAADRVQGQDDHQSRRAHLRADSS
jgi:glyoxylase-like metal-dependent hydrolase (beta-lactamase superfamily II)